MNARLVAGLLFGFLFLAGCPGGEVSTPATRGEGLGPSTAARGQPGAKALRGPGPTNGQRADDQADRDRRAAVLRALPYLATAPLTPENSTKRGVTRHLRDRTAPGLTVYCSEDQEDVLVVDLAGQVRHRIHVPGGLCKMLVPYDKDDFLMLGSGVLTRVSWDSQVRWQRRVLYDPQRPGRQLSFHHDLDVADNGDIYVLTNRNRRVSFKGMTLPIRDDEITVLSSSGRPRRHHSIYDLLKDHVPLPSLEKIVRDLREQGPDKVAFGDVTDILHTNTLVLAERDSAVAKRGQVLLCSRYLNLLAVVDVQKGRLAWSWGPDELQWPHHPQVLPNGHVMVYDNGVKRRFSRILQLDPRTGELVWRYRSQKGQGLFYSETRGSSQLLENDNILITESDTGRLFEVTRRGQIVWEYWNPDIVQNKDSEGKLQNERRLIYRAYRYNMNDLSNPRFQDLYRQVFHVAQRP